MYHIYLHLLRITTIAHVFFCCPSNKGCTVGCEETMRAVEEDKETCVSADKCDFLPETTNHSCIRRSQLCRPDGFVSEHAC